MNEIDKYVSPESTIAYGAIRQFQGIRCHALRIVLKIFPFFLIFGALLATIITKGEYIMYSSMIVAFALSIMVLNFLMRSIPSAFSTLWIQKSIASKAGILRENKQKDAASLNRDLEKLNQLDKEYTQYIISFEKWLNLNSGQLILGAFFSVLLLGRSIYEFWRWLPQDIWTGLIYRAGGLDAIIEGVKLHIYVYFSIYSVEEPLKFWTGITLEPLLGFFLGIVAWRMTITSVYTWKLGQTFDLVPQPENPDKCGGFKTLGNLSLTNALIISIWGAFLGGWIILGSSTKYGSFYTPMYQIFLLVPIIMAIITFFFPLWGIHQIMDSKRDAAMLELGRISGKLHALREKKIDLTLSLEPEPSNLGTDIERLQKVYDENKNYPTWPFDYKMMIAFITSQAVPLLGLTGIAQPILNVISSLMNYISQFAGT